MLGFSKNEKSLEKSFCSDESNYVRTEMDDSRNRIPNGGIITVVIHCPLIIVKSFGFHARFLNYCVYFNRNNLLEYETTKDYYHDHDGDVSFHSL